MIFDIFDFLHKYFDSHLDFLRFNLSFVFIFLFLFTFIIFVCVTVCDPAGPGFDRYQSTIDTRTVAQYSQCIHTNSGGRGTEERNCDQNWHLGHCGEAQPAAG